MFIARTAAAITICAMFVSHSFAQTVNSTLSFFDGALQVVVATPKTLTAGTNKNNLFTVQINDANGTPYPFITKEWVKANVEMTNMDMGKTAVDNIQDVLDANKQYQGKLSMNPSFSMRGPWKMNISITVSDDEGNPMFDTQAVTFDVNNK